MDTTFVARSTVIKADWLNDVNNLRYGAGNPARGAGLLEYTPSGAGAVSRSVQARLGDSLTDSDYSTLQAAITAAAGKTLTILASHTVTAALSVPSNTTLILAAGTTITTSTVDINVLDLSGKSGIRVYGPGKLEMTGVSAGTLIGVVNMDGASDCVVLGVEIAGHQWAGVWMSDATNCHALNCYIHDALGTGQDSAGATVYRNCVACSVEGNLMENTGYHGILVQGPGSNTFPLGTRVLGNDVNGATSYGIIVYQIDTHNTFTLVEGNRVRNVAGTSTGGSSGAGIYVQNSGGVRVLGNSVSNVCLSTSNNTLTPAGIAVSNIELGLIPPVVSGNTIQDVGVTEGGTSNGNAVTLSGIEVASSAAGAVLGENTIRQGSDLTIPSFLGLYLNASSNVTFAPQNIMVDNSLAASHGILILANNINISNISGQGGVIKGCDAAHFRVDQVGGFSTTNLSLTGGTFSGGSGNCRSVDLAKGANFSLTGVVGVAVTAVALHVSDVTQLRASGCSLTTSGTTAVLTAGTCTGGFLDASNYWGTAAGLMSNAAAGLNIEWRSNAAPGAGTWAIGDHTLQSVPVVASPTGWYCTVAGAPGTWVAQANL